MEKFDINPAIVFDDQVELDFEQAAKLDPHHAAARLNLGICAHALRRVHGLRRAGSAALDLCHVAAGRADGFWEFGLAAWDTAAGVLVAEEAGALVTDFDGRPWTPDTRDVAVANRELHSRILEVVRDAQA